MYCSIIVHFICIIQQNKLFMNIWVYNIHRRKTRTTVPIIVTPWVLNIFISLFPFSNIPNLSEIRDFVYIKIIIKFQNSDINIWQCINEKNNKKCLR